MEFTEEERRYYRNLASKIIGDEAKNKVLVDEKAARAIKVLRETMPDASDYALTTFASSVAYTIAAILKTPVMEAASMMESLFEAYTVVAAILAGAYNPEDKGFPECVEEPSAADDFPSGQYL